MSFFFFFSFLLSRTLGVPCWQWWSPWSPCGGRSVSGSLLQERCLHNRRHIKEVQHGATDRNRCFIICCDHVINAAHVWRHLLRWRTRLPAGLFRSSVPPLSAAGQEKQNCELMNTKYRQTVNKTEGGTVHHFTWETSVFVFESLLPYFSNLENESQHPKLQPY